VSEPLGISSRPPESALPPAPPGGAEQLQAALAHAGEERRRALKALCRVHPRWPEAWAALGEASEDEVEAYAYFRVGYHRGLDALRQAGWRGSGYVRWAVPDNRGFLRCLEGLRRRARDMGEEDEAQRCAEFLRQLDPAWPPGDR
jgi:hypothetical protein